MTGKDPAYYEDPQGRLRGLLIEVSDRLEPFTAALVGELIDANECGVALETLSEMLVESGGSITRDAFDRFAELTDDMALDHSNVDRLRPLIVATGDDDRGQCLERWWQ